MKNGPAEGCIAMTADPRIEDLTADQLRQLLTQDGGQIDKHLAVVVKQFIADIGGLENAKAAIAVLGELEAAS